LTLLLLAGAAQAAPPSTVDEFDHETIKVTMAGRVGTLLSRFTLQFSIDLT
jgi:hypothetical protein